VGVLLDRARKALGGGPRELPAAEPFQLLCACGQRVSGFRQEYRQFVRCPGCGECLFVLPVSPYPKPAPTESPLEPVEMPLAERPPRRPRRRRRPLGVRLRIRGRRMRRGTKRALWSLVPPRRWFSPVRLIVMAILLAIAGTPWLAIHLRRWGGLTGDIAAARPVWEAALKRGDFAAAREELDRASSRLKRYGSGTRDEREIEHLADEVALLADLLQPTALETRFDELIRKAGSMPPQQWRHYFLTAGNPSLVFDVYLIPNSDETGQVAYQTETNLFIGAACRLDCKGLKLFERLAPAQPTRVLFGARIEAVEPLPGAADEWLIRLAPDSGVLLTSADCLEQLGWPIDETFRTILESQKQWLLDQR
jgi:hypothetical protein